MNVLVSSLLTCFGFMAVCTAIDSTPGIGFSGHGSDQLIQQSLTEKKHALIEKMNNLMYEGHKNKREAINTLIMLVPGPFTKMILGASLAWFIHFTSLHRTQAGAVGSVVVGLYSVFQGFSIVNNVDACVDLYKLGRRQLKQAKMIQYELQQLEHNQQIANQQKVRTYF